MPDTAIAGLAAFLLAVLMTGVMRRYALARQLLDVPNARSSHRVSTPRGGGLAIVLGFGIALLGALAWGAVMPSLVLAVLPPSIAVAVIGFWDDHGHVPARYRIVVHFAAMAWGIYLLQAPLVIATPWGGFEVAGLALVPVAVAMVWFLNLFNFMDGIDGIAAAEAVFIAASAAVFSAVSGMAGLALALTVLAAAALGFLVWNWPPAKIFMGDVGSGFLGGALAILGLVAAVADAAALWTWVILAGVFVVDASVTLTRRLLRGERVYEAHRSHAYQWASRRWGHRAVTLGVLAINVCWLLPLGYTAFFRYAGNGPIIAAIAYIPLVFLALFLQAGRGEDVPA